MTRDAWFLSFVLSSLTAQALAGTLAVPADYATIQAAINAAAPGDTVLVADGVFAGAGNRELDFGGKAITLRSANGAAACVIDIGGSSGEPHRAFHFHNGETAASVVEGFTVRNGWMSRGGAVLCEAGSAPSFVGCVFEHNTAQHTVIDDGGGAVYADASSPSFSDCRFDANRAVDSLFYLGGGAVQTQSGSNPTFNACVFSNNVASGDEAGGGAVYVNIGSHPTFDGCAFIGNEADWDTAISCVASLTARDCRFEDNVANIGSGACGHFGDPYGSGHAEYVRCSFIGNSALGNTGGALNVQFAGMSVAFFNCVFGDNYTSSPGGGVWVSDSAQAAFSDCTFSRNTASAGGALVVRNSASVTVDNSILWGNTPNQITWTGGTLTVSYCDVEVGWPLGVGNMNADPQFVDAAADNYRLLPGSPCIDAGSNLLVPPGTLVDLAGQARFRNDLGTTDTGVSGGDGGSQIVDMGAYELQLTTGCPGDLNGDKQVDQSDLGILLSAFDVDAGGDFDLDGDTDQADLGLLLSNWAVVCP